jgi:Icc protein
VVADSYSRRRFLRQVVGAGAWAASGAALLRAQSTSAPAGPPQAFRFAFVTDLHLMPEPRYRAAEGIAACLAAVEQLNPRPEFILVGGDLVHDAREMSIAMAQERLAVFLQIWNRSTTIPARWIFGNHDLVATSNNDASPADPLYGKGLFKRTFGLPNLYYAFTHKGWRFIILDDIEPKPVHTYVGEIFPDQLAFLQADLDAGRTVPTIVSTHIPVMSNYALGMRLAHAFDPKIPGDYSLTCTNGGLLTAALPGHDVRAVLCGHLHHYERLETDIPFINSGAVCGNYWRGPMMGCPEGFGVVDVGADGSFHFDYRAFGWKSTAT